MPVLHNLSRDCGSYDRTACKIFYAFSTAHEYCHLVLASCALHDHIAQVHFHQVAAAGLKNMDIVARVGKGKYHWMEALSIDAWQYGRPFPHVWGG